MTSETTKRGIARTVCHELAHQWFGNLVTMEWWTQLYLNEGMARFMEFIACDKLFPKWDMWTEFVQSVFGLAMNLDAMVTSHPVEVDVNHPDEIDSIFDAISYAKGASIVRMIATVIGMESFFDGMRLYLTRHAYSNTVTNDLWQALQEVSKKPVVDFMTPWTKHVGYPIMSISNDGEIEINRFLATGPQSTGEVCVAWPIPITAKVEGDETILGPWILNGPDGDDRIALEGKIKDWTNESKWFKLNIDHTAFVRVNYTESQWKKLGSLMDSDSSPLSTIDRLGLLSDCFASGKAGYSTITDAFVLVESFGDHERAGKCIVVVVVL
jgi:puromycin-sensitive aminopeptidase